MNWNYCNTNISIWFSGSDIWPPNRFALLLLRISPAACDCSSDCSGAAYCLCIDRNHYEPSFDHNVISSYHLRPSTCRFASVRTGVWPPILSTFPRGTVPNTRDVDWAGPPRGFVHKQDDTHYIHVDTMAQCVHSLVVGKLLRSSLAAGGRHHAYARYPRSVRVALSQAKCVQRWLGLLRNRVRVGVAARTGRTLAVPRMSGHLAEQILQPDGVVVSPAGGWFYFASARTILFIDCGPPFCMLFNIFKKRCLFICKTQIKKNVFKGRFVMGSITIICIHKHWTLFQLKLYSIKNRAVYYPGHFRYVYLDNILSILFNRSIQKIETMQFCSMILYPGRSENYVNEILDLRLIL